MTVEAWTPSSWQGRPATQLPSYSDEIALAKVLERLSRLPPLVTSFEIERLKKQLAAATRGEAFLLQGGDCSETFEACEPDTIAGTVKVLLQMGLVLAHAGKLPVIHVGRLAGQYAKPRTHNREIRDGVSLPAYRGDMINRVGFDAQQRAAEPKLLLRAYEHSALTLNFVRSLAGGGFADLRHAEYWDLGFSAGSPHASEYQELVHRVVDSIDFLEAVSRSPMTTVGRVEFFTSHESLNLYYEQAQTRRVPRRAGWYNLTTHFPWIGDRTRDPDGAHVEFCRGIANPVAVKLGPSATPEMLSELVQRLCPDDDPGRLALVHRFGATQVEACLPPLLEAGRRTGRSLLWLCDPMHGNTVTTPSGVKTRRLDDILMELQRALSVHQALGSRLGGIHIELTGRNVTECLGGARDLAEVDLARAYRSPVDPRLNREQAVEIALRLAKHLRGHSRRCAYRGVA